MPVKGIMARYFLVGLLLALASCAQPPVNDKIVLTVGETRGQFELQLTKPYIRDPHEDSGEILAKVGPQMEIVTTRPFDLEISAGGETLYWLGIGRREDFYSTLSFICPPGFNPSTDASLIAANCGVANTMLHLSGQNVFDARETFEAMQRLVNAFESAGFELIFDGGTKAGFDEFFGLIKEQIASRATQYNSVSLIALQKGEITVFVNAFVSNDADEFRPKLHFTHAMLDDRHSKLREEAYGLTVEN